MKKLVTAVGLALMLGMVSVSSVLGQPGERRTQSSAQSPPAASARPPSGGGSFTDSRDGKTYRTVEIGNQTWMAENLNYQTGKSWCYENDSANCANYGRLYDWNTAMKACPAGWRLPSDGDWDVLINAAGGDVAGKKLKSKSGWRDDGNGTDDYGFSALPGGYRSAGGSFDNAGNYGNWWSATERDLGGNVVERQGFSAGYRYILYNNQNVGRYYNYKSYGFSVRCLRSVHDTY